MGWVVLPIAYVPYQAQVLARCLSAGMDWHGVEKDFAAHGIGPPLQS